MKKELKKKLKKIKAVVFDENGVVFSGRVFISSDKGEVLKERNHLDGQTISLLRAIGVRLALISGENKEFLEKVGEKFNSLPSVNKGRWSKIDVFTGFQREKKIETIENWLEKIGIKWQECTPMGDDLTDYQLLKKVRFSVAPLRQKKLSKKLPIMLHREKEEMVQFATFAI